MKKSDNIGLYFIKDKVAECPVTSVMMFQNDLCAIRAFKQYLDSDTKIGRAELSLYKICVLNSDYEVIVNDHDCIVNGSNCDDLYNDLVSKIEE